MALQIQTSPSQPGDTARDLARAIREALPGAEVHVEDRGPGHFEIRVVAAAFEGLSRLKQQQLVYGAIAHLMKGNAAPVHAIDRLQTELP
ncbi:MAG: BolA/IbaG family iron-sulfur metabolism protein [Myxococcota bacterium]